jgi:hypothetical protein
MTRKTPDAAVLTFTFKLCAKVGGGWLDGMIPLNPDIHDFTKDEH